GREPRPRRGDAEAGATSPSAESSCAAVSPDARAEPMVARRGVPDALDRAELDDAPSAELEPVEPAEPCVSAKANPGAAIAAPTPNATASAPTRPT
ncbi:MAG: hypothetical protein KDB47_09595, partial [Mycobacterium sp.]|nr:hypothetical protein [Mycobacterium sp.]